MSCFTPETMIQTVDGEQPVEWLEKGVRVITRDHGAQPIRAIIRVTRTPAWFAENPDQCPVEIARGGLDHEFPLDCLRLGGNHRMLLRDSMSELYFGFNEVLVPLRAWGAGDFMRHVVPEGPVTFTYLIFEQHEIIQAEGVWVESFFPDAQSMASLDTAQGQAVMDIMDKNVHAARQVLTLPEAELVVRPLQRIEEPNALTA